MKEDASFYPKVSNPCAFWAHMVSGILKKNEFYLDYSLQGISNCCFCFLVWYSTLVPLEQFPKGVDPVGYYFDSDSNKIHNSKKVKNLNNKRVISFCADDPNPPYKGVRGKGELRVHEEVNNNRPIAERLLMRSLSLGSLEHPTSKWLLGEIEKGNEVVLEISPRYYSTWDYGKTIQ